MNAQLQEALVSLVLTFILFALLIFSGCSTTAYTPDYGNADVEQLRYYINNPGWSLKDTTSIKVDEKGNTFINN